MATERTPTLGLSFSSDASANRNVSLIDGAIAGLMAGGVEFRPVRDVTANTTLLPTDAVIVADSRSAAIIIQLPPLAGNAGRIVTVCAPWPDHPVNVNSAGSDQLLGFTNSLGVSNQIQIIADPASGNWWRISG